ncbi:MAG TPA: hypothetical protein VM013_01175 [Dehalococcoidia bacterium]|nr:hypothetical protein [Dehalococcoidia bacterium]
MTQGCCVDKKCTPKTCMDLPEGTTCGDCGHIKRCQLIFGHVPDDTYCDWFPRRFYRVARPTPATAEELTDAGLLGKAAR